MECRNINKKMYCLQAAKPVEETEKSDDIKTEENLQVSKRSTLEERRKSLLDTHWAIPSRDR